MAFNPLLLLGQQAGAMAQMPEEEEGTPIFVTAPQERPTAERMLYEDAQARPVVQPRYVLNDDRIAPRPEEMDEILPRQGMFGVKGTLRNVLGTLGDAFLAQAGQDPIYRQQRLREQAGDAMFGAANDPMQAAERLAAAGFVKEAQDLIAETNRDNYQQGMLASTEGNRQDQASDRRFTNVGQAQTQLQRILANASSPEQRQRLIQYYGPLLSNRAGVSLEDLGIFEGMSDEDIDAFARGDMTVNQQQAIPFTERRVKAQEQNADSYEYSVRNRNPPPRPRSDTDQEMFEEIGRKRPEDRQQWENDFYRRFMEGTDGRGSRIPSAVPPPSNAQPSRFRRIN